MAGQMHAGAFHVHVSNSFLLCHGQAVACIGQTISQLFCHHTYMSSCIVTVCPTGLCQDASLLADAINW